MIADIRVRPAGWGNGLDPIRLIPGVGPVARLEGWRWYRVDKGRKHTARAGWVGGWFARVGGAFSFGPTRSWPARLSDLDGSLTEINGSTEGVFLTIGSRLQELYARSSELAAQAAGVPGLLGGSRMTSATEGLAAVLEKVQTALAASAETGDLALDALARVDGQLNEARAPLEGFGRIVRMLRILGVSTKIENARLGAAESGFGTLAEDARRMADAIESQVEEILDRVGHLRQVVAGEAGRATRLLAEHRAGVARVLEQAARSVADMREKAGQSGQVASQVADWTGQVNREVGEVVVAIQFHDITRQQIEHVAEAFRQAAAEWAGRRERRRELAGQAARLSGLVLLQRDHLHNARKEFVSAVDQIVLSLQETASTLRRMARGSQELVGSEGGNGEHFLGRLKAQVGEVADSLAGSAEVQKDLAGVIGQVAGTVRDIDGYVQQIDRIGFDIKMVALNALVKAAHTGSEGAALGTLAESIQQLSVLALGDAGRVSSALRLVHQHSDALEECLREERARQSQVGEAVEGLAGLVGSLEEMRAEADGLLTALVQDGENLAGDIDTLADGVGIHRTLSQKIDEVCEEMAELADAAKQVAGGGAAGSAMGLDRLAERYTMERERQILQTHLAAGGTLAAGVVATSAVSADAGVELFAPVPETAPPAQENGVELWDDGPASVPSAGEASGGAAEPAREDGVSAAGESVEPAPRPGEFGDNVELF